LKFLFSYSKETLLSAVVSSSKIDRLEWYFLLMKRLYTLKEAKMLLGVTTETIRRWGKEGKMRVVRTIGGRRMLESEIKRILGLREERQKQLGRFR
jgi:excisionase family DNA binding protein